MLKRFLLTFGMALAMTVVVTGTASAAPAQTAAAPATCVQSVQNIQGGAGAGPTQAGFGISFSATCPGKMLVGWQAIGGNGRIAWKSEDHHFIVSTTTDNVSTATWTFGNTPSGTYDVYVTMASQNGKAVYFRSDWMTVVVP